MEHKNCSSFNFFSAITGSYVNEEQAAKAHDLAALKYWGTGPNTKLNFNVRISCCLALNDICYELAFLVQELKSKLH